MDDFVVHHAYAVIDNVGRHACLADVRYDFSVLKLDYAVGIKLGKIAVVRHHQHQLFAAEFL